MFKWPERNRSYCYCKKFKFPASFSSSCQEGAVGTLPALSPNSNMPSGLGCEPGVTESVTRNPGGGVNGGTSVRRQRGERARRRSPRRLVFFSGCSAPASRPRSTAGLAGTPGVTQPNPLPKQGHPEQAAQDYVQVGLEYLQRRLHSPSGQPVPGLRHPQREEVLPHLQLELPLLHFVPVAPCPVAGHHWKESGPILLTPTLQRFISISKVPSQPSLLQAEQAQLPQPLLGDRCSRPLIVFGSCCLKVEWAVGTERWVPLCPGSSDKPRRRR